MLERGWLAIEPARAAWRDGLAAAQRVRQLTHGHADACEGLVASLTRWPSFAVADPWAITAEMPTGPQAAEGQGATKRPRSSRETLAAAATRRPAPSQPAGLAATSRLQPGGSALHAPASPASATTTRAMAGRTPTMSVGAPADSADAPMPGAAVDTALPDGSTIATLVAQAIARHIPSAPAGASTASRVSWSDLLPGSAEPAAQPAATSRNAAPSESRPVLQALDLPVRAALERIAQTEAPRPVATLLAPAAELLQRLLPDPTATASVTHDTAATTAAHVVAPRAPSRLLADPGRSTSTPTGARPSAPDSTLPDEDDEASADAISRLLADQAWLRGVDFT